MDMTVVGRVEEFNHKILKNNRVLIWFILVIASYERIMIKQIYKKEEAEEYFNILRNGNYVQVTGTKAFDHFINRECITCIKVIESISTTA